MVDNANPMRELSSLDDIISRRKKVRTSNGRNERLSSSFRPRNTRNTPRDPMILDTPNNRTLAPHDVRHQIRLETDTYFTITNNIATGTNFNGTKINKGFPVNVEESPLITIPWRVSISNIQAAVNQFAPQLYKGNSIGLFYLPNPTVYQSTISLISGHRRTVVLRRVSVIPSSCEQFAVKSIRNLSLPPYEKIEIPFVLSVKEAGYFQRRIIFEFDNFNLSQTISFKVLDSETCESDLVFPETRKYLPKVKLDRNFVGPVIEGEKPLELEKQLLYPLSEYEEVAYPTELIPEDDRNSHVKRLHQLVYLEKEQMEVDIKAYTIDSCVLVNVNQIYWKLGVPGILEARPCLFYGDRVIVATQDGKRWSGFVHVVEKVSVLLKFSSDFHHKYSRKGNLAVSVDFDFNRTWINFCHLGIDFLSFSPLLIDLWCFPTVGKGRVPTREEFDGVSNHCAGDRFLLNKEQALAVASITTGCHCPIPFVVFGPPGTGKTRVVVQATKQLVAFRRAIQSQDQILILTPSDAAADLIIDRLSRNTSTSERDPNELKYSEMVRINSPLRPYDHINEHVKQYTIRTDPGHGDNLDISRYSVIVCTLLTSAWLNGRGLFKKTRIKNIFVDECGQCSEPEFWSGVVGPALLCTPISPPNTDRPSTLALYKDFSAKFTQLNDQLPQLVLVGDPKQLGPVIRSPKAEKLQTSILERFTETLPAYSRNENFTFKHPQNIVQLNVNYRCNNILLDLFSKTFYNGTLRAIEGKESTSLMGLEWLPAAKCPLIFHNVLGNDEREDYSPSWFNNDEVNVVVKYVKTLFHGELPPFPYKPQAKKTERRDHSPNPSSGTKRIFQETMSQTTKNQLPTAGLLKTDIGIISPYRKQIEKIRLFLRNMNMEDIKVGNVDEFQGDERKVIIVSGVRSWSGLGKAVDSSYNVGFLKNPKRFNVGISRAKALLILVGNAEILSQDVHWRGLIETCMGYGCCVGNKIRLMDEIVPTLDDDETKQGDDDEDVEIRAVDVAWRKEF